jgi:uncharacterized protein YggU (UPF0235/DUF167 family)
MATIRDACRADQRDTLLAVRVQPGARRDGPGEVRTLPSTRTGQSRAVIVWHVRARAIEGRANTALVRSVAEHVGVAPSSVEISHGQRGREKVLRLRDCVVSTVVAALNTT